ncbi:MAG: exodeoxyribonuclease VII large subunit [Clostridia bacterium]|nr:exodeoxyribonuclease VII large subunit [Clostridia bacterium]
MIDNILTVRQLNLYVKSLLEGDRRLVDTAVTGEISNFKNHFSSGHWYFTLKDKDASIRCVMFRSSASRVTFNVCDGMLVTVRGRVSLYEKDGQYQFYAEEMYDAGEGDLALKFKLIKEKLEKEGLFDRESKRPIPKFPKRIAVITSDTGAAVQDMMNILGRRYPVCEIVMCPVLVQGENAASDMIKTLDRVYSLSVIDTVIIGRGGGSAEDLDAFNNEALARKIYESPIPVISAVGHETDFTICDFVADKRAATPSEAAELAVPDKDKLSDDLFKLSNSIKNMFASKYQVSELKLSGIISANAFANPFSMIESRYQQLDGLTENAKNIITEKIKSGENKFSLSLTQLEALNPLKVIARGFSVAECKGRIVKSVADISKGDSFTLRLSDGCANCLVEDVRKGNE